MGLSLLHLQLSMRWMPRFCRFSLAPEIIMPDTVRGDYDTLVEAVHATGQPSAAGRHGGWPLLAESRG